jgi:L-malate glycosyltransferase
MRICYLCVGDFSHIGPYIKYFKSAGHDVHFISLSPGPDYEVKSYNVGFGTNYSRSKGKWKYPLSMLLARRLVRKLKPDVLHTHYVTSGGLAGVVCGFHPTITTVHGSDLNVGIKSQLWRPLIKMVFNHADCINTCTEDQKRKVVSMGISETKIEVLTLGIDSSFFSFRPWKYEKASGPLRLVTTRHLEAVYDHSTVVKAIALARSRGVDLRMTFVADGSLYKKLKAEVEALALTDLVTFLGGMNKDAIADILHEHDVFISSPLWDGISVALLEAMSSGLFPIASDIDVNSDWIKDGLTGFLHRVGDSASLADYIVRFWNDPSIAKNAIAVNRQVVIEHADTTTNMRKLEKIYSRLITGKNGKK